MLKNDFYNIILSEEKPDCFIFEIKFNPKHKIYDGHFPANPVVPGVCLVQIIKELTEEITRTKLMLVSSENIKFLNAINPVKTGSVNIEISVNRSDSRISVKAKIYGGAILFLKCKCIYHAE